MGIRELDEGPIGTKMELGFSDWLGGGNKIFSVENFGAGFTNGNFYSGRAVARIPRVSKKVSLTSSPGLGGSLVTSLLADGVRLSLVLVHAGVVVLMTLRAPVGYGGGVEVP